MFTTARKLKNVHYTGIKIVLEPINPTITMVYLLSFKWFTLHKFQMVTLHFGALDRDGLKVIHDGTE